jgi:DGQHR domain-containing protein
MEKYQRFGSVSLIKQGDHRFYSFTMPSDILADSCYVVNRDEDPIEGFQRVLDERRAREIATYIDSGMGTIPSSIVLSAQDNCNFKYDSKAKSVSFLSDPKAFLIIDGQHRVYGFKFAQTALRIPVVVYEGLSKRDETRLFIDINSKQRGVPPELLLDIKKLAGYENDQEQFLRELFDLFLKEQGSVLRGQLSAAKKLPNHITRTVFNTAMKPLVKLFVDKSPDEIFSIYNAYLTSCQLGILEPQGIPKAMSNTTMFKALASFFPTVTSRVKDRHGPFYTVDNYYEFTQIVGERSKIDKLKSSTNAYKPIVDHLEDSLKTEFSL